MIVIAYPSISFIAEVNSTQFLSSGSATERQAVIGVDIGTAGNLFKGVTNQDRDQQLRQNTTMA